MSLQDYFRDLVLTLQKFRETDFLCDTVLITADKCQLKAHSVVLAAASSVFLTAFNATGSEATGKLQVRRHYFQLLSRNK